MLTSLVSLLVIFPAVFLYFAAKLLVDNFQLLSLLYALSLPLFFRITLALKCSAELRYWDMSFFSMLKRWATDCFLFNVNIGLFSAHTSFNHISSRPANISIPSILSHPYKIYSSSPFYAGLIGAPGFLTSGADLINLSESVQSQHIFNLTIKWKNS